METSIPVTNDITSVLPYTSELTESTPTSESTSQKTKQKKVKSNGLNTKRTKASNKPATVKRAIPSPAQQREKIILAEDNLICQKLAVRLLTKNGYSVTATNNGLEAVQAIENSTGYDIALLDIHMPVMDGLEAGRTMRNKLGFKGRIIALTANTTSEYQQACIDAGFDAFASKPIKESELMALMARNDHQAIHNF